MAKNKSATKSRTAVVAKGEMTLAELNKQESVIEQGEKTFVSVGNALIAIRDGKGYKLRGGHKTFEEYCQQKWNFGVRQGQRLIEAANTVNAVRKVLNDPKEAERIVPNEAVARQFAKVANKPETLKKVVAKVQGQARTMRTIKANAITQAIKEVAPSIAAKPPSPKKPSKPLPAHTAHAMSDVCPACKVTPKTYERDESGFKCGKCHAPVLLHVVSLTSNVCESCGAANKAGAKFCISCGEAL